MIDYYDVYFSIDDSKVFKTLIIISLRKPDDESVDRRFRPAGILDG